MESLKVASVRLSHNPLHLGVEAEIGRRRLSGVHLEILCDRIDVVSQHLQQRCVGGLGRKDTSRQQHDTMAIRHD